VSERRPGGPASAGPPSGGGASPDERVVVRDKRKVSGEAGTATPPEDGAGGTKPGKPTPASGEASNGSTTDKPDATAKRPADGATKPSPGKPAPAKPGPSKPAGGGRATESKVEAETSTELPAETEPVEGELVDAAPGDEPAAEHPLGAELEAVRSELEERTRDLQRVSAEYANYRKRVDRDRGLVAEQALGSVIAALLPVLDDLDRARDHGDLVGPFGAVAEQLNTALGKFGLSPFGEKGDPFDPTRHEAVAHLTSAEVTEPTCIDVMRRGYLLGDRLLRPALVAVADPE